jgi:hypothetical protein
VSGLGDSRWRLDRRVSVGQIVTTLAVAVGVVLWLQRLEAGTMLNAQATALQSVRIDRLEDRNERQFRDIKESLVRIEQVLDRKADRR